MISHVFLLREALAPTVRPSGYLGDRIGHPCTPSLAPLGTPCQHAPRRLSGLRGTVRAAGTGPWALRLVQLEFPVLRGISRHTGVSNSMNSGGM